MTPLRSGQTTTNCAIGGTMKPEDLMNVPMEKQDLSGCAHRKQTKEEALSNALASVNANPPKMNTFKMNTIDRLKQEMLSKIPHIKTLPLWDRIKAHFKPEHADTLTETNELGTFSISSVQIIYEGKYYFKRWGRSN